MIKQYTVDAFTDRLFSGNPAAVCLLDSWLEDEIMQGIACENNLSETAFLVRKNENYLLRWFTPGGEVDLCGHATLASAHVVCTCVDEGRNAVEFDTRSGILRVSRKGDFYEMSFPSYELAPVDVTAEMAEALGTRPREAYLGRDLLCIFGSESEVRSLAPDFAKLAQLEGLLVHATAPGGGDADCVSRSFAPKLDVNEDPVCGSGHCHIFPYWARVLGKAELTGVQASKRGGILYGRVGAGKVELGGNARLFCESTLVLD